MDKTDTKNEAMRLRVITFAIAMLEAHNLMGRKIKIKNIAIELFGGRKK